MTATTTVGPLTLDPSTVVRQEPNLDELTPPGFTQWLVSTPISVLGRLEPGDGGSHDPGIRARIELWRVTSLLAVAWEQPWWPLHPPQYEFLPLISGSHLTDPDDARLLGGFAGLGQRDHLPSKAGTDPDPWWDAAWDRLTSDREIEGIARSFASTLRTYRRGPLDAELALTGFIAILDAAGKRLGAKSNTERVRAGMVSAYERHHCPELRTNAEAAAAELHQLAYTKRCKVTHEAAALSLIGESPGPLGDKPNDLDPGADPPLNTRVLRALATQARLAVKTLLDCPAPEKGACIHSHVD